MNASPIPVVLVTGALGSGKTTVMRRLLAVAASHRIRPAIIVNEFGAVGVDGPLLRGFANVAIAELSGGCICCSGPAALRAAMWDVVLHQPEVILIETSGLADPVATLDALTMPDLLPSIRLGGVITVVDAHHPTLPGRSPLAAGRQFALADLIVANKADLASPGQLFALSRLARQHNPRARLIETRQGAIPGDWVHPFLRGMVPSPGRRGTLEADASHASVRTLAVPLPEPLDRATFEAWLRGLPDTVLRAKGFARFAPDERLHVFQFATGVRAITALDLSPPPEGIAILIGTALDEPQLRSDLHGCRAAVAAMADR